MSVAGTESAGSGDRSSAALGAWASRAGHGSVITPDGSTLIVAESWAGRLTAFDIRPYGSLTNRRVWADLGRLCAGRIALDAEDAIWLADAAGKRAIRVRKGGDILGAVLDEISAGDLDVSACALGGDDGHTPVPLRHPRLPADTGPGGPDPAGTHPHSRVDVPHAGRP